MVGKPHSHDKRINLSSKGDRTLFEKVWNAAKRAYSILHATGKYTASDIAEYSELINATNDVFVKAIERGVKSNVIPARMMTSLENDVFVFSALKTYAQLFEASRQLLTDDGKVKSFQQFSQDVAKIEKDYNQAYLQAEYNFAVSSAQQAANWAKIEENGDRYNLQYRTAGDDRVRDSHEALNEITLPPSDAFWNSYYPPNGWNCRCVAVEVLKDKYPESDSETAVKKGAAATMQIGKDGKNRMEIFRFNPGKEKVIFPQNHPYYPKGCGGDMSKLKGMPEILLSFNEDKCYIKKMILSKAEVIDREKDYKYYKENENYILVRFNKDTNGLKATHKGHLFSKDTGHYEKKVQQLFYEKGYKFILENEKSSLPGKKTDGFINSQTQDISTILGMGDNTVKRALNHSISKNADVAILYFTENTYSYKRLQNGVNRAYGLTSYRFKDIYYIVNDEIYKY